MRFLCFVVSFCVIAPAQAGETFVARRSYLLHDVILERESLLVKGSALPAGQQMPDGKTLAGATLLTEETRLPAGSVLRKGTNLRPGSRIFTAGKLDLHVIDPMEPSIVDRLTLALDLERATAQSLRQENAQQAMNIQTLTMEKERLQHSVNTLLGEKHHLQSTVTLLKTDKDDLIRKLCQLQSSYDVLLKEYSRALDRENALRRKCARDPDICLKIEIKKLMNENMRLYADLKAAWDCIEYYRSRPPEVRTVYIEQPVFYYPPPPVYYYRPCPF